MSNNNYIALSKAGLHIISVQAPDMAQGKALIQAELEKPGRGGYLTQWHDSGSLVKEEYPFVAVDATGKGLPGGFTWADNADDAFQTFDDVLNPLPHLLWVDGGSKVEKGN